MALTDGQPVFEAKAMESTRQSDNRLEMLESTQEFRCFECGRPFHSLRALHSHESLTEVRTITNRLCSEAPGRCRPNRISGRCETHSEEARQLVRDRQRLRYVAAGKNIPLPLRTKKRRPALARLVEAYEG
jgi:hypothetical protein